MIHKVTVVLTTYNHERFISQAVDSVLAQKTNFGFNLVILEDCSTDNTRKIVQEYQRRSPEIIHLQLADVNKCDNAALMRAILGSSNPYIALLDGDDYWTVPHKLQRQVDFLEQHPECSICFHNTSIVYDDGSLPTVDSNPPDQKRYSTIDDLIDTCFVQTCSTMYRRSAFDQFPDWYEKDGESADWSLLIVAAHHGTIGYIDEVMGVYRQHAGGFWTSLGRVEQLERVVRFYQVLRRQMPQQFSARIDRALASSQAELDVELAQRSVRNGS